MKHKLTLSVVFIAISFCSSCAVGRSCNPGQLIFPGAKLTEQYVDKAVFFEGPCWDRTSNKLYFCAWGNPKQVLRLDAKDTVTVWINDPDDQIGVNGIFYSNTGILLTAQVFAHKLVSYVGGEKPQQKQVLAYNDKWNQPNDVCQSPAGEIYFSDPQWDDYFSNPPKRDGDHSNSAVYCIKKDGSVCKVIDDLPGPNGVIVSNDGKTLYVADSIQSKWWSYPIIEEGVLGQPQVFFELDRTDQYDDFDRPDGSTIDEYGNVYLTGLGGVRIVSPSGKLLKMIPTTEKASNVTFGGADNKTLFITCDGKLYSLQMSVRGGG